MPADSSKIISRKEWLDEEFCQNYSKTWDISTKEVHYGWLSPGESELQMIDSGTLQDSNVLDLGCGMGENLIALANKGARCFGVDISLHMLRLAKRKVSQHCPRHSIKFEQQDMRDFSAFQGVMFDIILSVYSFEFLPSLTDFRETFVNVSSRIKPGGVFIFCFSHPLQHRKYQCIINDGSSEDSTPGSPLIYSFQDVFDVVNLSGLLIERVVEQSTKNPSTLDGPTAATFPYRFFEGKNPCRADMDGISNTAPHTVVYRARKPENLVRINDGKTFAFEYSTVHLWGEKRKVTDCFQISVDSQVFDTYVFARRDSLVAICHITSVAVGENIDVIPEGTLEIAVTGHAGTVSIRARSLLGIVHEALRGKNLLPEYCFSSFLVPEYSEWRSSIFLSGIAPLFGELDILFPRRSVGVLVFLNGREFGEGKVSLENYIPSSGDIIEVVYAISGWHSEWRNPSSFQREFRW